MSPLICTKIQCTMANTKKTENEKSKEDLLLEKIENNNKVLEKLVEEIYTQNNTLK